MSRELSFHDPLVMLFAIAFTVAGLAMMLVPERIRDVALRSTEFARRFAPFGDFQYRAVRRREYPLGLRLIGIPIVLGGAMMLLIILRS